jgi:polar amino acid transport system substrate-binding protein
MNKLFIIVTSIVLIASQSVFCEELTILTENLPPLNYVDDGILVGPSVETVKEIQRRIGSNKQIQVYPWARAYKMALKTKILYCLG